MAKIKINDTLALFTNAGSGAIKASAGRKLVISTHGGWSEGDGVITRAEVNGVAISFYSAEDYCVTGNLRDALKGKVQTIDTPLVAVKNYELTRFEHDPSGNDLAADLGDGFDALKVRTKFMGSRRIRLKDVIQTLQQKGYQYAEYCCLFCRYTGKDLTSAARDRTSGEAERLGMLSKQSALTQELKGKLKPTG